MTHLSKIKTGWLALFFLLLYIETNAQYKTAIGVRLGGTSGFTVKHQIMRPLFAEVILGTFINGFSITGLLEKNVLLANTKGLYLYYGGGGHMAFYNGQEIYYNRFGRNIKYRSGNDVGIGINLVLGLEYKLPDNIPIAFAFDLKPFIEFGTGGYVVFAPDPSVGIKFTLPYYEISNVRPRIP